MKFYCQILATIFLTLRIHQGEAAPFPALASGPEQVSRTTTAGSFAPVFSGDGKFLFFASGSKNLISLEDTSRNLAIYRLALGTGTISPISVNSANTPANADGGSFSVSSNGDFIVFTSRADNLIAGDTNQAVDIFLRDTVGASTRLVSEVDTPGGGTPIPPTTSPRLLSDDPSISANGRWVVFESYASNLVSSSATDQISIDIFVRDVVSNLTTLASISTNGTVGRALSHLARITPNGRFVSFLSSSAALVETPPPPGEHLFVRDLQTQTTTWVTKDLQALGVYTNQSPGYVLVDHTMNADGKIFAYKIRHPGTSLVWVFRYDLNSDTTLVLSSNSNERSSPRLSSDGRFLAYEDGPSVYVWDQVLQSNILVTVSAAGVNPANGISQTPALSDDGRYVAFVSSATDLTTNANSGVFQVFLRDLQEGSTRLISRNTNGIAANASHEFVVPVLASDGSRVAFESDATDLVENDGNTSTDVFLYDVSADTIRVAAEADPAKRSTTRSQPSGIVRGALTTDGALLAFFGYSVGNPNPTNKHSDVFVRNLASGTIEAISLATNSISNAEISADGRYVVFNRRIGGVSASVHHDDLFRYDRITGAFQTVHQGGENQSPGAGAHSLSSDGKKVAYEYASIGSSDVYVRDYAADTDYRVTQKSDGSLTGGSAPLLSPDDQRLLFIGTAFGTSHVFLKNLNGNSEPTLVSHSVTGGDPLSGFARAVAISGNSQIAAFTWVSAAPGIYQYKIVSNIVSGVCSGCQNPAIDFSGLLMVYESFDSAGRRAVALQDLETSQVTVLSDAASLGQPPGAPLDSWAPVITPDGRFILFVSRNASSPTNVTRLYARDRALNQTLSLTPNAEGIGLINRDGAQLGISRDGHTAVFRSFASDLVANDYNDSRDVFVIRLGGGDSDGDGMDDDWEMAYFGNLSRDGSGDFDNDGQTDLQEFRAGTDPTNNGSVLRTITVTSLNGRATLFWSAVAGRSYRVEFKQNAEDPGWTTVTGQIRVNGSTGSIEDVGAASDAHRFYRVVSVR